MTNCKPVPEGKDPVLWEIAQRRASFRKHASTYVVINLFLWAIWYFTRSYPGEMESNHYPWPIWTTLGWGIGIAFHYISAYVTPKENSTEKEYEKLINKS